MKVYVCGVKWSEILDEERKTKTKRGRGRGNQTSPCTMTI